MITDYLQNDKKYLGYWIECCRHLAKSFGFQDFFRRVLYDLADILKQVCRKEILKNYQK
jgi:hypothetical protein